MGKMCKFCDQVGNSTEMIKCASCKGYCHPSCLELPMHIVPRVKTYNWQCNDCKHCYHCEDIENEEQILFCDACDRGYHMYCLTPKVKKKPKGNWFCPICEENKKESESQTTCIPKKMKNACPFPGCDGSGNVRTSSDEHASVSECPFARDERKREIELLSQHEESAKKSQTTEEKKTHKEAKKRNSGEKKAIESADSYIGTSEERQKTCLNSNQKPIEHIVSRTDLDLFEKSKEKAEEVSQLEKEMAPHAEGLKIAVFGSIEIEAWYKSQYPIEVSKLSRIYVCEFCLSYLKSETICERHTAKCDMRNPPGSEIYRKNNLSVFEVDGQTATTYCQNLCLFAKLFLDHKTLWMDVAPFLFYVMTEADETGCHIVGYFSKEKVSFLNYNVSCILIFPQHMRKGYGKMLIEFSYLLSKVEGKIGSPEKPLSDLGLISYRKYWQDRLLNYLMSYNENHISVKGISEEMSLHANDVISTLQFLGMLKYWKGKHLILLKKEIIEEYANKVQQRGQSYKEIDPTYLQWTPKNYKLSQ